MEIRQEELSDLPLIAHFIQSSGLPEVIDRHYSVHGNWRAPSFGKMVMGWLLYMISECDHRLYTVQDWAAKHSGFLGHLLGCDDFSGHCFHDDRLGLILEHLSDSDRFAEFMADYNEGLLTLYELPKSVVRVDSFNVPSYREEKEGGLFRHGYKKSHQADEPHMKVMAACLDPLAMPLAVLCAPGSVSDDALYFPVIERARQGLKRNGLLYVGDTKLGSAFVCGNLAEAGDFYLSPLSHASLPKGCYPEYVKAANGAPPQTVRMLYKAGTDGEKILTDRIVELPAIRRERSEGGFFWMERRIMVYSLPYAKAQEKQLRDKVTKAKKEIEDRFAPKKHSKKWRIGQEDKARAFIDEVSARHGAGPFLRVALLTPAKQPKKQPLGVLVEVDDAAIGQKLETMGWRLYITNVPAQTMEAGEILLCYRNEYLIEHQFHKILTKTTGLLPINLKNDNRCAALVNLVILALQFISLIQHRARINLKQTPQPLTDVVPGNKNKKVDQPTAELMLKRFKSVNVVWVRMADGSVTIKLMNFQTVHAQILKITGCPDDLYMLYAKNCFP